MFKCDYYFPFQINAVLLNFVHLGVLETSK